jgi:hypothetical protein
MSTMNLITMTTTMAVMALIMVAVRVTIHHGIQILHGSSAKCGAFFYRAKELAYRQARRESCLFVCFLGKDLFEVR